MNRRFGQLFCLALLAAVPAFAGDSLKLVTQRGYLPANPVLVRVELLTPAGQRDRDVWDIEATLATDQPGVTLSTNKIVLRNGLGSALVTFTGGGDFNLTATIGSLSTNRLLQSLAAVPVTTIGGTLPGTSTTWSNVVNVTNALTVPVGHTLTILPNTLVLINGIASGSTAPGFTVSGGVQSLGTEDQPVTFTCATSNLFWGQILHSNPSLATSALSTYRHTILTKAGNSPAVGHTSTGPMFRLSNSSNIFENCTLSDNIGKMMYAEGSDLQFTNCQLARSIMGPEIAGTAIKALSTWITEMHGTPTAPEGTNDNDGIYLHSQQGGQIIRLQDCVVADCQDDGIDTLGSTVTITNCIIRDCTNVNEDAKGISGFDANITVQRSLIVNNLVGVSMKTSAGTAGRYTISDSTIQGIQRAVAAAVKANAPGPIIDYRITNCILVSTGAAVYTDFGATNFTIGYTHTTQAWPGTGNLSGDPLFVNVAANDYHLQPGSPAINTGNPASPLDPDGTRADMGYYQFSGVPTLVSVSPAVGNVFSLTQVIITFSKAVTNVDAGDLLINGVPATSVTGSGAVYTFTFPQPAYGLVNFTWVLAHGIVDLSTPTPQAFDGTAPASVFSYTLLNASAPTVASQAPPAGTTVGTLAALTVNFSEAVTNVDAADLLVNGVPATGLSGTGASRTFTFTQPAYGPVAITWAVNHGITDIEVAADPFNAVGAGATWSYTLTDLTPPAVLSKNPPAGATVTNLTQIQVTFTEAVTGVSAGDLLINGVPATGVSGLGASYTFTFVPVSISTINVSWAAGHGITDLAAVPNAFNGNGPGATWQYQTPDHVAPGAVNIAPLPGATVQALNQIVIQFSEPVTGVNASDLLINNVPAQSVLGSSAGPYTFQFIQPSNGPVQVAWSAGHGITDVSGTPNAFPGGSWSYDLNPAADFQNQVVINEIFYQSPTQNDLEEWIELRNLGPFVIDLTGWKISKGIDFTFSNATISAGGYLVVAAHPAMFTSLHPGVTNVVGGWIGSLKNSGEQIRLDDNFGRKQSEVTYAGDGDWAVRTRGPVDNGHRGWEWVADHSGLGKSVELINPNLPQQYGQNWAASVPIGGTPGAANSVLSTNTGPLILETTHFPVIPRSTNTVAVTTRLLDELTNGLTASVYYRLDGAASFTVGTMFDDGLHGDGLAGDGVFGIVLPPNTNNAVVEFYVVANDQGGHSRTWPSPAMVDGVSTNAANLLYQVDDSTYAGTQPFYRLIMREVDRAELRALGRILPDANSDAQMNGTFISTEAGSVEFRYLVDIRDRGHGSRTADPNNYRINFRSDDRWHGNTAMNLNTQYTHAQVAGSALFQKVGLPMAFSRAVQVRVNNGNLANSGSPQFGSYAHNEELNGDFAANHFPLDPNGNVYRGIRVVLPGANLSYLGGNVADYQVNYFKQNNVTENDWSDLINLTYVLNNTPNNTYFTAVNQVVDVDEWLLFFAVNALVDNNETNLGNGDGDDYGMYRGLLDTRFRLLPYDLDTIMGEGNGTGSTTASIFRAANVNATLSRFLKWPDFAPRFYGQLKRLLDEDFSPTRLDQVLNRAIGTLAPSRIPVMESWQSARNTYVRSQIPLVTTVSSSLPVVNGYPRTVSPVAALNGSAHAIDTRTVLVNGVTSIWSGWEARWTNNAVALQPGINRVLVQSLGTNGLEVGRSTIDIWYDDSSTVSVGGALAGSNFWSAAAGPYTVTSSLTIPNGATLMIEPGTTIYLNAGVNITVANGGRLLAAGTGAAPIRFTRTPGTATSWGGMVINGAAGSPETLIAYAHLEFNGTTAITSAGGAILLDHLTFGTTTFPFLSLDGSSFLVSDCLFPKPTAAFDMVHGTGGIRSGGRGIFLRNYFGAPTGSNDVVDFTGGSRIAGQPIVQFINNVFVGSDDDVLKLNGADAWVEGNIFLHVHRNGGTPDSSAAISAGSDGGHSPAVTIIGNLFYDCDQAATARQGAYFTFLNNTVVHQTPAGGVDVDGAVLNFAEDGIAPAAGMHVEGNILYDIQKLVRNLTNATAVFNATTFTNNLMPLAWTGPGGGNSTVDPHLQHIPQFPETTNFTSWTAAQVVREWFGLQPGSPAAGNGPNRRDQGGEIALGASIAGEPYGVTAQTGATLTVGLNRSGGSIPVAGFPGGSGWTHYKWRLDGGSWSAETPIATPVTLAGLANGAHYVEVAGRNDAALYQNDPALGADAAFTRSRTWTVNTGYLPTVVINEVLARNVVTFQIDDVSPDLIELFNPGALPVDLSNMGLTDNPALAYKFAFPPGTTLGSGQYLVLYADSAKSTNGIHLGFSLGQNGAAVYLRAAAGQGGGLIDSVSFGPQLPDLSIGRRADGSWGLTQPTFGSANLVQPTGDESLLKINEWFTDGVFANDFVELYNPDSLPVALGGLFLSDAPQGSPGRHPVAPLSFIGANGYVAFTADGQTGQGPEHLNFKLTPQQGSIGLFAANLDLIDCIFYGQQTPDVSEGRRPNGADTFFFFAQPTPGSGNPFGGSSTNVSTNAIALMPANQVWKFDQVSDYTGVSWFATNFNDSGWASGPGVLAVEDCACLPLPINTTLTLGRTTYYFRSSFVVTSSLAGFTITADLLLDDGAVLYLNGVELTRIRMSAGTVLYSTFATSPSVGNATTETITIPAASLRVGTNLLAVEVHQQSTFSSDIVWNMKLDALQFTTNVTQLSVTLNEIMANNHSYTNLDGTVTDWVELYNPGGAAFDLSDMSLTDDLTVPRRWVFPAGATLAAGGRLVVRFNSGVPASTNLGPVLNTGFGFSAGGDGAFLFDALARGGALVDSVVFGLQAADFSIGRVPDAGGPWLLNLPTEGVANIAAGLGNPAALRINEWMANPKSGEDYFEIYNPNNQPVDLGGMYLTDNLNNRTQYRIHSLSFIGTGFRGYALFQADNAPQKGADHTNFKLNAGGESIGLFAPNGVTLLDGFAFGAQQSGVSEGRFPDGGTNIVRFPGTDTPGTANYLPFTDVVINEALAHTDLPFEDAIELFNPTDHAINIGGWYLSDTLSDPARFPIPPGTILQPGGFVVFYEHQFNPNPGIPPSFALSSVNGEELFLSQADGVGNLTGYRTSAKFGASENGVSFGRFETSVGVDFVSLSLLTLGTAVAANDPTNQITVFRTGQGATNAYPKVGPVVISEIHYHPPDLGTNDNQQDEFIELHNFSGSPVPLFDPLAPTNTWHLRNAVDFDFATNTYLPAGGYLLVVSFDPVTNTAALAAFTNTYGLAPGVVIVGPYGGKLNNGGDTLELNKPDAPNLGDVPRVLVEKIKYADDAPWPSAADGNTNGTGISLQRRVAADYANDPVNWIAAVPTPGAASGAAVVAPPVITIQPTNRTVLAGVNVTFTSAATGAATLRYQWRFNGIDLFDATNASLTINNAQSVHAGIYSVRVSNPSGTALSASAILAIQNPPLITQQPVDVTLAAGASAAFTVGAGGTLPLVYQWRKDGTNLAGANAATLLVTNVQAVNEGSYTVVITNVYGAVTSVVAVLQINAVPVITAQPTNLTVIVGQPASFAATVTGSGPLRYQWRLNNTNLAGATNLVLTLPVAAATNAGNYSLFVSNTIGTTLSTAAVLTVIVPPTVTVVATDPSAAEAGLDPGRFTITRSGTNGVTLTVNFNIGGTALNGGDYSFITGPVVIPSGTNSVTISVLPVDDPTVESAETVVLTLAAGAGYLVGSPSNATVTIIDNDNLPPVVSITSPTNNSFFPITPTNILLSATATDDETTVAKVEFYYRGTNFIGRVTNAPYDLFWTNAPAGTNLLTAVATDDLGLSATSAPVVLIINAAPTVAITSPANNAAFAAPADITINANAADSDGSVTQVNFYASGILVGTDTGAPYSVVFTNVPIGAYQLSAVATDNRGLSATSSVVNVTVNPGSTNFSDSFAGRGVIQGVTNFSTGSNAGATVEAGEPAHWKFNAGGRSVWLSWPAAGVGYVTIDLVGSTFDTLLAVYTNVPGASPTVSNLVKIAENDDTFGLQSQVVFTNFVPGTVYQIAVDGYSGASGSIQMHLSFSNALPVILTPPASVTTNAGSNATFTVTLAGAPATGLQWRFNGGNLAGRTNSTLTLTNLTLGQAGNYDVVVSNSFGSVTSAVAVLTVRVPPSITTPPQSLAVSAGSAATFTVVAGGTQLAYQWKFNGANIPGATGSSYTVFNVQPTNGGNYSVTVTNQLGATNSPAATLTVLAPPFLVSPQLTNGLFKLILSGGNTNRSYYIDVSTNLAVTNWTVLATVTNVSGQVLFTDTNAAATSSRFYRARLAP